MLSISGNDFIAHWAYDETISSHTEHTPNKFSRMLSQQKNVNSFYMYSYAEHTGYDFIAPWAYEEMILSHPEHTRKCLKVGQIEYDFQKSRVTGPWDHIDSVSAKKVFKKFHACVPLIWGVHIGARALLDINLIWFGYITCLSQGEEGCYFTRSNDFYLPSLCLEEVELGSAPCDLKLLAIQGVQRKIFIF